MIIIIIIYKFVSHKWCTLAGVVWLRRRESQVAQRRLGVGNAQILIDTRTIGGRVTDDWAIVGDNRQGEILVGADAAGVGDGKGEQQRCDKRGLHCGSGG